MKYGNGMGPAYGKRGSHYWGALKEIPNRCSLKLTAKSTWKIGLPKRQLHLPTDSPSQAQIWLWLPCWVAPNNDWDYWSAKKLKGALLKKINLNRSENKHEQYLFQQISNFFWHSYLFGTSLPDSFSSIDLRACNFVPGCWVLSRFEWQGNSSSQC